MCQENLNGLEVIYFAWPGSGYEAIIGAKQTQIAVFIKPLGKDVTPALLNSHQKNVGLGMTYCSNGSVIDESRALGWEHCSSPS